MTPRIITSSTGIPVQVFDLSLEPCVLKPRQWSQDLIRDPSQSKGLCLHQWDSKVSTALRLRQRYGEPEALARRALKVPAHLSAGVCEISKIPIVCIAHPPTRYLMGSDAANAHFLGLEVMGKFPFTEGQRSSTHTETTPELEAAVEVALQVGVEILAMGSGAKTWSLITHRQACNGKGDHIECCGEPVLAMACKALPLIPRLEPRPDQVLISKWGKGWPDAWKAHLPKSEPKPKKAKPVPVEPPFVEPELGDLYPPLELVCPNTPVS